MREWVRKCYIADVYSSYLAYNNQTYIIFVDKNAYYKMVLVDTCIFFCKPILIQHIQTFNIRNKMTFVDIFFYLW